MGVTFSAWCFSRRIALDSCVKKLGEQSGGRESSSSPQIPAAKASLGLIRGLMLLFAAMTVGFGQELSLSELAEAADKNDERALTQLRKMGSRGNVDAQLSLALHFHHRPGKSGEAIYWYVRAARGGASVALIFLADLYLADPTVRSHRQEVIAALQGPAARGVAEIQLKLGQVHLAPGADGRPYNVRAAVSWLVRAGRRGEGGALLALAEIFHAGNGVRRDLAKAVALLETGKRMGHLGCSYFLARLRVNGDGVRQDTAGALAELDELDGMGFVAAGYEMGLIYAEGGGTQRQDLEKARLHMGRAARAGMAEAQLKYGEMHAQGLGGETDRKAAYQWVYMAAQKGHKPAQQYLRLLDMTTPKAERAEAIEMASRTRSPLFCGTPFLLARERDADARAKDESPVPVIDWDGLAKLVVR